MSICQPIRGLHVCLVPQLFAALPPDKQLDFKAERLRLLHQLVADPKPARGSASAENSSATLRRTNNSIKSTKTATPRDAAAGGELSTQASQQGADATAPTGSGTKRPPVAPKIPELISGHYVLDFGSVVKGVNKSRKVKMTNMSSQLVGHLLAQTCLQPMLWSAVWRPQALTCFPLSSST